MAKAELAEPPEAQALAEEFWTEWKTSWNVVQAALQSHRDTQERMLQRMLPTLASNGGAQQLPPRPAESHSFAHARRGDPPSSQEPARDVAVSEGMLPKRPAHKNIFAEENDVEEEDGVQQEKISMRRRLMVHRWVDVHAAMEYAGELEQRSCCGKAFALVVLGAARLLALHEPERASALSQFLSCSLWETLVACAITLNTAFLGFSTDYSIRHVGEPMALKVTELAFMMFFVVELALRIAVHRLYFFWNEDLLWKWFDFALVAMSTYDIAIQGSTAPAERNVTFMRSMRLLRLARALRALRVFKFASPLRRMLHSVLGSFMELFWSCVLMSFIFYLFSIATMQGVTNYLSTEVGVDEDPGFRESVRKHFGGLMPAMLTYYKATSGGTNWGEQFEMLAHVDGIHAALFVFVIFFTQIALMNIVTGIYVEAAMKVAQPDRMAQAMEQRKIDMRDAAELRQILTGLNGNRTGNITWREFRSVMSDQTVKAVLEVMGLDIKDAGLLFRMLQQSGHESTVDFDFLVDALLRMKGPASSLDLQSLAYKTELLLERVNELSSHRSLPSGCPVHLAASPNCGILDI
mmetsp:Transcript_19038/g.55247  ORF Transcript_19038/g.55247 Transcript_19038/m.55247 type:complete len:579 (+) Transcript_19038:90-1826(+)